MSKKIVILALVVVAGVASWLGYQYYLDQQTALPPGIAAGNGRLEAKQVDVAAKEALRVKEILAKEGDLVEAGQVIVRMDTSTLESELNQANANIAASKERVAAARSSIVRQKSLVENATIEEERMKSLFDKDAASEREYLLRKTAKEASEAALGEEEAKLNTAEQEVRVAEANAATIQTKIDDATLKSPVRGRVLYRLVELGEVLPAGGKALTLINLEDVYMEIFLPAKDAGRLRVGAEARLVADHTPGRCVAGRVTFVSPEAQFTPKQVETASERDKLMFRVKIQVPDEMVQTYIERVKTGVRGMGYVKVDESAEWPAWLANPVAAPPPLSDTKSESEANAASTNADEAPSDSGSEAK